MKCGVLIPLLFTAAVAAAQQNDRPSDPPPDIDGRDQRSLSQTIASGLNYYTFIPLSSESVSLRVDNQSKHVNDILLVGEDGEGNRVSEVLRVKEQDSLSLSEDLFDRFDHIYLISMQPFHVYSEEPIEVLGLKTRHFATVAPSRSLEFVQVENALGKTFLAGVMPDGSVHYPVYGYKFGEYDANTKSIYKENGAVYEVLEMHLRR